MLKINTNSTLKYFKIKSCCILFGLSLCSSLGIAQAPTGSEWKALYNGKDLKNWDTYLKPSDAAADQTPIGLNKDPHKVFTVVDGVIRISGQDWGGISTKEEFENYHLRFQIKWGEKKWPPREHALKDGGLLFHCSEPFDFGSKCWMRSNEMQIQQGEIGDFHNVGAGTSEFQLTKTTIAGQGEVQQYDPYSTNFQRYSKRVYRSGNFESKEGEWTTGEMVARGADAVFIVNGFVVNRTYNIFREDLQRQTTKGRIQFQSEGAEHFLKGIELRPLPLKVSKPIKLISNKKEINVSLNQQQSVEVTNQGDPVEIIAAELLGKNIEQFVVKLPAFPLVLKKGEKLLLPVSLKESSETRNNVKLRLETLYGPVEDFEVVLISR